MRLQTPSSSAKYISINSKTSNSLWIRCFLFLDHTKSFINSQFYSASSSASRFSKVTGTRTEQNSLNQPVQQMNILIKDMKEQLSKLKIENMSATLKMLLQEFIVCIAIPMRYYFMDNWFQSYNYRTDIQPGFYSSLE